jgi:GT2 family glycosyltransferase
MSRDVFISIVSHAQEDMIVENFSNFPKSLGLFNIKISIIDNTGSDALKKFCEHNELFYYHDGQRRGFGANNNKIFSLSNPKDDDVFIVCNPDILIQKDQLDGLLHLFVEKSCDIFSVKTYFNKEIDYVDNPDKYFPGFLNFAVSLASDKRLHYGTNQNVKHPKWISGAFMVFSPGAYRRLNGFDESYFMYCEDIDICYRANKMGMSLCYDDSYYIEHDTQMDSRSIFSPSMRWHVESAVRFVVKNRQFNPLVIVK